MLCLKCLKPLNSQATNYGLHLACFKQWFNISETATFQNLARRDAVSQNERSEDHISENNSFFHGKFKKYSAMLDGTSYILKMRQSEAPELPEVEYLCNQIGSLIEIPVAEYFLIRFEEENVFVTKNFIRQNTIADLQHIYHYRDNNEHSCDGLIQTIKKYTKRPHDVKILIHTILFDALIGNHDRHGRNLGFIVQPNKIELSPIYDNVSYLSLEQGSMLKADFNPTGKISTSSTSEPNMKDYVLELKTLGYADEINSFISKIKIKRIEALIKDSFCSDLMKEAFERLMKKRLEELEHAL